MVNVENLFRLVSIAALGLVGFACVRESDAPSSPVESVMIDVHDAPAGFAAELEALREVNEINTGKFNPHIVETGSSGSGDESPKPN